MTEQEALDYVIGILRSARTPKLEDAILFLETYMDDPDGVEELLDDDLDDSEEF